MVYSRLVRRCLINDLEQTLSECVGDILQAEQTAEFGFVEGNVRLRLGMFCLAGAFIKPGGAGFIFLDDQLQHDVFDRFCGVQHDTFIPTGMRERQCRRRDMITLTISSWNIRRLRSGVMNRAMSFWLAAGSMY